MKFDRLRIVGFKSFVDPTEFVIEPGITGVVGPNGCGKSNLTEALRWVMGETSTKNMRAGGMDEVIFAGTTQRPARNTAEVVLYLDNSARTAPASFNDADALEVSRRIERDGGSTYRVNGREVRARDVQLLFADASTGARSPALVRQGQIAELIAAKPTARRRLLEDAAGIAGLHARRNETENRLRSAETNLERLQDVLQQMTGQLDGLKRQARQAVRYRALSAEIREAESLLMYRRFKEAEAQVADAERALDLDIRAVANRTEAQTRTATEQAVAAHALPGLREEEAKAAAVLQRLSSAREQLDAEERRAVERSADLDRRIVQLDADIAREHGLAAETAATLERLSAEAAALAAEEAASGGALAAARATAEGAARALDVSEQAFQGATSVLAETQARRNQLQRAIRDASERMVRLDGQIAAIEADIAAIERMRSVDDGLELHAEAVAAAKAGLAAAESAMLAAESTRQQARDAEARLRGPLADAERTAQRLETEASTLKNLLARGVQGRWRAILDEVRAEKGYEAALGAALGDDLDASTDPAAPARWAAIHDASGDALLPEGVEPIARVVTAPPVLARRLAQIGLTDRATAERLAPSLKPGQRLVTREGELWRWDGYVARADAPSASVRRLQEKNRLGEVEAAAIAARARAVEARAGLEAAQGAERAAAEAEAAARTAQRTAQQALQAKQDRLSAAERAASQTAAKLSALFEAKVRLTANVEEAGSVKREAIAALEAQVDTSALEAELAALRAKVAEDRAALAEARAAEQALRREAELRARRIETITAEAAQWRDRSDRAARHTEALTARLTEARAERDTLDGLPGLIREKRLQLLAALDTAEAERRAAADRLAAAETRLLDADRAAREAQGALAEVREQRARTEARLEAARERRAEIERVIAETLEIAANRIPLDLGLPPEAAIPEVATLEGRLDVLKRERERLGAVNLRAEEEASEVEAQLESMQSEKEDLEEAIRRLRTGISNLNRDARERLLAAHAEVAAHFQTLFAVLFGGGTAELLLTESDDPLEAGLDIVARPPGKKPQSLSLLSGGEQALTATALIFAVFLTNPAPICVLDEVDAPLDDANVERYCDLLVEMTRRTSTRFVVITHNPITMSRMDRLFGVTMAERGVSQLVSVDLSAAERLVEAA